MRRFGKGTNMEQVFFKKLRALSENLEKRPQF